MTLFNSQLSDILEAVLLGTTTLTQRRVFAGCLAIWPLCLARAWAELPQGVVVCAVRIQLDQGALQTIPGDERIQAIVDEDASDSAQALIRETPPGRGVPVIFIVIGVLSIPVIWDTIREMLRRDYYGGVIIDGRQTPALVMHDRGLPANIVLFIGPNGKSQRYDARSVPEDILLSLARVR